MQEVGKIIESIVADPIIEHFDRHNLWHKAHHGGTMGLLTFSACAELRERILMGNDKGGLTGILLVDQKTAYDVIDHDILIGKLTKYNICDTSLKWFSTYLNYRSNQVMIQSSVSKKLPIGDEGTIQGSVLGGLLFLINSNDLPKAEEKLNI